jgi:hypothetical protein
VSRAFGVLLSAALLGSISGCFGDGAKPNVDVHMVRGSVASECTQIARYNVLSTQKLIAAHGTDPKNHGRHDEKVNLAVFKTAANQLAADDPVRIGALKYVAHGTTFPYFQPCRRLMNLADVGKLPRGRA